MPYRNGLRVEPGESQARNRYTYFASVAKKEGFEQISAIFTETADNGPTLTALRKAIVSALNVEKKRRGAGETANADWYKELKPTLLRIGAVTLAPSTEAGKSSGLTFHYPPYAVGPYAEGQYVIFVPWETLKPYLTAEGAKIFGGARPKGDADDP